MQGCESPDKSAGDEQRSLVRVLLGFLVAMACHVASSSARSRVCGLIRALARVNVARVFLCGITAVGPAPSVAADVTAGRAVKQAAVDADADAQAPEKIDQDVRTVWVLALSRSMSEAGPVTGIPEIVVYEVDCTGGRLVAAKRTHEAYPTYGSRTWVVQIDQAVMSSEGAQALRIALEGMCQSQRR